MFKKYLQYLFEQAVEDNHRQILALLEANTHARFLDVGCDDGRLSQIFAKKIHTKDISGIDVVDERMKIAKKNGVRTIKHDINTKFPLKGNTFDVIHANQVIEHLWNVDIFLGELYRILKPGGYAVISTENASSWCNIGASVMGWQIFSLTNISAKKRGIGNPLALHRGGELDYPSWFHIRIYNIRGLIEYAEAFGFIVEQVRGAGYFPLPSSLGHIDKTHAHFITLKLRKPS